MRVIDPGHVYHLAELDGSHTRGQGVAFVKREGPGYPGNVGHHAGTTCQELLRVLIDRVHYLDKQERSSHNDVILDGLQTALHAFEARAAGRHKRKVPSMAEVLTGPVCAKCGHVGCVGECHLMIGPTFFYYAPHRAAVEAYLRQMVEAAGGRLQAVQDWHTLQGMENQTFVDIAGHPDRIPTRLHELLATQGFIIWTIDDSAMRGRYEARYR